MFRNLKRRIILSLLRFALNYVEDISTRHITQEGSKDSPDPFERVKTVGTRFDYVLIDGYKQSWGKYTKIAL